jgi:hypothetical protein
MGVSGLLRVLVTGSRRWTDAEALHAALLECWYDAMELGADDITVVHGAAPGADTLADLWAIAHQGLGVLVERHPADWSACAADCGPGHRRRRRDGSEYCPTAGHRRNQLMVDLGAAVCVALPLPGSSGTWDCVRRAELAGIDVRLVKP